MWQLLNLVVESSQISMGGRGRGQMKERLHVGGRYFVCLAKSLTQQFNCVLVVCIRCCQTGDAVGGCSGQLCAQVMKFLHA